MVRHRRRRPGPHEAGPALDAFGDGLADARAARAAESSRACLFFDRWLSLKAKPSSFKNAPGGALHAAVEALFLAKAARKGLPNLSISFHFGHRIETYQGFTGREARKYFSFPSLRQRKPASFPGIPKTSTGLAASRNASRIFAVGVEFMLIPVSTPASPVRPVRENIP